MKSALKKVTPREPSTFSAKSVGVGSHNIDEQSIIIPPVGGASSSNQENLLQGPPMHQSINS
jgi:hypothetical protein